MTSIQSSEYLFAGIEQLGKWLREGRCTPENLAELALTALHDRALPLNAVVNLATERARGEAEAATTRFSAGTELDDALPGIPYGAKDLLATSGGLPTTWGAEPLRHQVFADDATVIKLLRSSGAVLCAKLAMVELAGGGGYYQPDASLTGPARNPWNPDRWTGGSSSGSAAAVACGALPFSIGSETRGSILMPASYCGVVGVRPTYDLVSRQGAMTLSWSMDKIGPIARSVDDCARVLEVIGVPDVTSPGHRQRFRYRPARMAKRKVRFGLLSTEAQNADEDIGRLFDALIPELEQLGSIEEMELPSLPYGDVARLIIASEASSFFEDFIESGKLAGLRAPESHVIPYTYGTILAKDYIRALRVRSQVLMILSDIFSQVDILVAPTTARTASSIDQPFTAAATRDSGSDLNVASNLAGCPAVTIPIGLDSNRLPVGLQLVGGAFKDEELLVAAARIERAVDWRERPPEPSLS